ncbi:hypothetical protein [Candidatus Parabeggiatoa sp. HSG14]|uniref:hypothetical protein n=1 Tax=Candidatus Parabeggiatoa sp. HSG14 TaxID=3055593 RepID=UPI0025A86258|nr:hypothetical protein [Thiotrichales bacterium HSG14]
MRINATNSAFIDAIANSLGVLIIVTLLLILLSQYVANKQPLAEVEHNVVGKQDLRKVEHGRDMMVGTKICRKTAIRSWPKEYIVMNDLIVPLNKKEISKAIITSDKSWGEIDEGKWELFRGDYKERDIDVFELEFTPNIKAIETNWQKQNPKKRLDGLLAELQANSILFFFVYPSGMNIFSSLYPLLLQKAVRFQVVYQPSSTSKVIIWRDSEQFDTFEIDYHC